MNRYHFLFIVLFSFFPGNDLDGISPHLSEAAPMNTGEQDTLKENQTLYNGRLWRNQYYKVRGYQFLFSDELLPGSLTINGSTYNNVRIRYDIYNDEIMTPANHGSIIQLNKEMVDSFTVVYQNNTFLFTKIPGDSVKNLSITKYFTMMYHVTDKYFEPCATVQICNRFLLFPIESPRAHWLRRARKLGSPLLAAGLASIKHQIPILGSKIGFAELVNSVPRSWLRGASMLSKYFLNFLF